MRQTKIVVVSCSLPTIKNNEELKYFTKELKAEIGIQENMKLGILPLFGYSNGSQFFILSKLMSSELTNSEMMKFFGSEFISFLSLEQRIETDCINIYKAVEKRYPFLILVTYSDDRQYLERLLNLVSELTPNCSKDFIWKQLRYTSSEKCYTTSYDMTGVGTD